LANTANRRPGFQQVLEKAWRVLAYGCKDAYTGNDDSSQVSPL